MAAGYGAPVADSDETLVLLVTQGDQAAFEELYERFFKRIYLFVDKRVRNPSDTEEIVQEVFINIFNSIGSYRGDAPFGAWVYGVTRRTIASRFKRKRHTTVPLNDEDQDLTTSTSTASPPSPLESYECEELLALIEEKIQTKLSAEQRELFQLHHLEDRPISEIAKTLQKSENAVKSNLYRARKILLAR